MDERNDMRYDQPAGRDIAGVTVARFKRLSWGAIFAGTVVVLIIQATLSLLGLALGLHMTNVAAGGPSTGLSTGALIWWVVTFIISLFIGGWVTGRLGGAPRAGNGALHGLVTWGLSLLVLGFMLTSVIGSIMGGALGVLRSGLSAAGTVVAANTQGGQITYNTGTQQGTLNWDNIRAQLNSMLGRSQQARPTTPGATTYSDADVEASLDRLLRSGGTPSEADRQATINMLVARTNMTRDEATRQVDQWIAQYRGAGADVNQAQTNAGATARQVGQTAVNIGAKVATWAFVFMILGGIACILGGAVGAPREDVVVDRL